MTRILAVDPGNTESGWVLLDTRHNLRPLAFGKDPNPDVLALVEDGEHDQLALEMVASYGMAVGADVFETCVWIGRYYQADQRDDHKRNGLPLLIKRHPIKLHWCHSARAKDSNITQALVDRFAPGQPNRGKGTKAAPGFFYGFKADIWQAMALAVYVADTYTPANQATQEATF